MTERKRRRLADALSRLTACVDDMREIGEDMSVLVKRDAEPKPLPLRIVPTGNAKPSAISKNSTSLMSLVPAVVLQTTEEDESKKENWREKLTALAKQLAATDPDAQDRCSRLLRRYDSLSGSVKLYETKLKQQTNDVAVSEQIESRLEQEEKAWEVSIEQREKHIAELQSQLDSLRSASEGASEEALGDEPNDTEADADVVMENEVASMENQSLREALALRMEEKRDIEAAIQSLRRNKRSRSDSELDAAPPNEAEERLREELKQLTTEKESLEQVILMMEAEQEQVDAENEGVSTIKAALEESESRRQLAQDELDKLKHVLARLKAKMKHMVDVQILSARDTNPPTITEEIVILHLLFEHAGEMEMNDLKQAATETLATYGKTSSSAVVLRAIYSLVGSLAVHIDRSIGNGVVTSLLV